VPDRLDHRTSRKLAERTGFATCETNNKLTEINRDNYTAEELNRVFDIACSMSTRRFCINRLRIIDNDRSGGVSNEAIDFDFNSKAPFLHTKNALARKVSRRGPWDTGYPRHRSPDRSVDPESARCKKALRTVHRDGLTKKDQLRRS